MTQKLQMELSGIFNWALEGYKRLKSRSFKFKEVKRIAETKTSLKNQNNSVLAYASECLVKSESMDLKFSDVYGSYRLYCSEEGLKTFFPKKEFKKILRGAGFKIGNNSKNNNQVTLFGVAFLQN